MVDAGHRARQLDLAVEDIDAVVHHGRFAVVDWSRDRGIFDVGRGTDLESAIAICRLHAGHDDFMYFEHGVTIALIMGGDSNP